MILYTVFGPPGRSHSSTNEQEVLKTKAKWDAEGYETRIEHRPYQPVRQDYAYWKSIYPDGNFPAGV